MSHRVPDLSDTSAKLYLKPKQHHFHFFTLMFLMTHKLLVHSTDWHTAKHNFTPKQLFPENIIPCQSAPTPDDSLSEEFLAADTRAKLWKPWLALSLASSIPGYLLHFPNIHDTILSTQMFLFLRDQTQAVLTSALVTYWNVDLF